MRTNKNAFAATGGILIASITAVVVGAMMLYVGLLTTMTVSSTVGDTLTPTAATGTLTFSGNVSNGELINITTNDGSTYLFEFNTTAGSTIACLTANCIPINLTDSGDDDRMYNLSWEASGNLTDAINANASTAAIVTAVNSTNLTTLTYYVTGTGGNAVSLSGNAANITLSGLSGGVEGTTAWEDVKGNVNTSFTLLGILMIVGGAGGLVSVLFGWTKSTTR